MSQETKWPASSYNIGDIVQVKEVYPEQEAAGVELGGYYRVTSANHEFVSIMTTKRKFPYLSNEQVERWDE